MAKLGTVFVELSLDDKIYKQKLSENLTSTEATAKGIETSWKTLGTRSDAVFDAQRRSYENALTLIKNSTTSTTQDIIRAEEAKNAKLKQLNEQQYGHNETLLNKMGKNIESTYSQIFGALSLAAIGHMAKQTIEASLAMERMNLTMSAAIGNSDMAAKEMQYIREESERLGLNLNETALAYAKFSASTRNTAIEGEETRRVFSAVAEATTALKLSTEQTNGVFLALSQMMSKGKIQAEELRGQLGERLPGAFQLTADAMGITTAELDKMLQDGKVISADVLPKLATKLHETYGDAAIEASKSGQAAINRFNNEMLLTKAAVGDALMPTFIDLLNMIKGGVPVFAEFTGGFKMAVVDVAAAIDKYSVYFKNFTTFAFGSPEEVAAVKAQLLDIEKVAESTKKEIYDSMNKGVSSAKTAAELAAEKMKTTASAAKNAIKDVNKEQQTALKHANEQIEKDLNKLTLTVEEQIQEQADKWEKLGVNKTKIQEWTSAKMEEINQKEAEKILKIQQAANEQIAQHRRKATEDYEKLMSEEADFAMNENERAMAKITAQEQDKLWKINVMLQEETISWEQYELARTQITANAAQNRLEKELNEAKRRADINYSAIQNIKGMEEEAFQLRLSQIDAEAAKRIKDGGDAVLIAKWVADEQQKAYIQMGKAGDDWVAGVQASLLELTRQHTTWGSTAYEVTKTFTDEAKAQLSDNFFNLFKGNIDELGFDWDTMWDKMLQTLSKKISDMVIEAAAHDILLMFKSEWVEGGSQVLGIVSSVLGFAGNLFGSPAGGSTGYGDWTDGLGFAQGGRVPGLPSNVDNTFAMLASGEHVIPANLVSAASQGRGGDTMLAHINSAEATILKMLGGSGTINPRTGLPEFYNSSTRPQDAAGVIEQAQTDLAAYRASMAKIAQNLLIAQEAKAKGYSTLLEGENLVYVSGYRGGEPIGNRSWAPTTALDTSAGSRYYIPLDLLLGGAMENASGKWFYPFLQGGAVGFLQSLSTINAPASWPAAAGIPGTWGAIDNPTHGFYVTPDQYRNIYAGGYWVPSQDLSWMGVSVDGIPVSAYVGGVGGMSLAGSGVYGKNWGGEDIWGALSLDPTTGAVTNVVNQQWGANGGNGLGGLLETIGTGLMTIGGAIIGGVWGMPWLGAGAGNALAGVIKGDDAEDVLKNAAMAGAMTYVGGKISDWLELSQPGTSAGEIIDINAGESAAWGYDATTNAADMIAAMQEAGTMPTTFDEIVNKGMQLAAKSAIKFALNAALGMALPTGDTGGYMQVSYLGANDGGLLSNLAGIMSSMQGQGNINVNPFSAKNGLDYVPYDNFPIRAHKGEAVLNKQEATEWRQSNAMDIPQPVQINLVVDGSELAEILFNISKRGVAVVHERGIGK